MKTEAKTDTKTKILFGLDLVYEKMLAFKKQKNSEIIIWRDNKIVRLKP